MTSGGGGQGAEEGREEGEVGEQRRPRDAVVWFWRRWCKWLDAKMHTAHKGGAVSRKNKSTPENCLSSGAILGNMS